jgi:uncharacterized protein (TIGR03067 family)
MRTTLAIGLALAMTSLTSAMARAEDEGKIEGTYILTGGENDGQQVPEERVKGSLVKITRDTISVVDKDKNDIYVAKYKLDTTRTPTAIMMTNEAGTGGTKGEKARGIVRWDGDTLKLCYAPEGGTVPTSFTTKAGTKQNCFIMKRKND